ncbi:MAG: HAMP domain-containing sensor histidine kinase [Chitinophagaceae bacterium]
MNLVYRKLSGFRPVAKSYSLKFLFIAFIGIHIPLIGLIVFIVLSPGDIPSSTIFLLTLGATVATLLVLRGLLSPLHMTKQALEEYILTRSLPDLPMEYPDEAGILMHRTQETVVKLDTLIEEKKDLIGLLSHDLRLPLANIKLLSEHLKSAKNLSEKDQADIATMIWNSAQKQIRIFQDILNILKYEDIEMSNLSVRELSPRAIIEAAWTEMEQVAKSKNVNLVINEQYRGKILADRQVFPQVIKNLLSNAVKFSNPGFTITAGIAQKAPNTTISVADTGAGFDNAHAEELFERFTARRKNGTDNEPSIGMGLYLSRKIINAHEGTLTAHSEGPGHGAVFTIRLPA